jgi:hypothetical protein
MPNSYNASIGQFYPSRKGSEKKAPVIITFKKRPRTYPTLTVKDRREQLFGSSFNYINTTTSVARVVVNAKKGAEE